MIKSGLEFSVQINTGRLRLVALSVEELEMLLFCPEELETRLGMAVSRANLEGPVQRALRMKIERMHREDPALHPWSTYWLIITPDPDFGAGMVGFKGAPDANGSVEIGYGIDPAYREKGYMTEAVRAMIAWAFGHEQCRTVTATGVLKDNLASQRVLIKAGMAQVSEDPLTTDWKISRAGVAS